MLLHLFEQGKAIKQTWIRNSVNIKIFTVNSKSSKNRIFSCFGDKRSVKVGVTVMVDKPSMHLMLFVVRDWDQPDH